MQQLANHLGVLFLLLRPGCPVLPERHGLRIARTNPPQQARPLIEGAGGGPEGVLQAAGVIGQRASGEQARPRRRAADDDVMSDMGSVLFTGETVRTAAMNVVWGETLLSLGHRFSGV